MKLLRESGAELFINSHDVGKNWVPLMPVFFLTGYSSTALLADAAGSACLIVLLVAVVGGAVGFWYLSRVAPKGTVLAVAAGIYVVSWLINPGNSRELHGLVGFLRLLGFVGGVLGVIDLVKKRPPTQSDNADDRG